MDDQLKYKVTYGFAPQHKEAEVYAFTLLEAIQIANRIESDIARKKMTKVEQISDVKEFN